MIRDEEIPGLTRDAVGKDSYNGRALGKIADWNRAKPCVRPTALRIEREKSYLLAAETA